VFISLASLHYIYYCNCKLLVVCAAAEYYGLAIDVGRQKLYYTDQADPAGKLGELSTDGTGHRVLISDVGSKPRAVVIDDVNR